MPGRQQDGWPEEFGGMPPDCVGRFVGKTAAVGRQMHSDLVVCVPFDSTQRSSDACRVATAMARTPTRPAISTISPCKGIPRRVGERPPSVRALRRPQRTWRPAAGRPTKRQSVSPPNTQAAREPKATEHADRPQTAVARVSVAFGDREASGEMSVGSAPAAAHRLGRVRRPRLRRPARRRANRSTARRS